jgi:hypothetical protein
MNVGLSPVCRRGTPSARLARRTGVSYPSAAISQKELGEMLHTARFGRS